MFFRDVTDTNQSKSHNSASPEIIWGPGGPEEDHQLHHCCWTGRVGEREEEEVMILDNVCMLIVYQCISAPHKYNYLTPFKSP